MIKLFLAGFLAISTFTVSFDTANSTVLGKENDCPKTELCQTLPQCNNSAVNQEEVCCTINTSCDSSEECTTCPPNCPPTPSCPCVCE